MSYTTKEKVKILLQSTPTIFPNAENEKKVLTDYDKIYLQYTNIDTGTEVVKIIRTVELTRDDSVTLNDYTKADLTGTYIVPNTVVVSDSLTLENVYVENKDYLIDYQNGKISRCTVGSSITNGQAVYVWYIPFVQLASGSDYDIVDAEGSISRRAGTSIPDGATVYVDYSHSQGSVPDDLIDDSILQVDSYFNTILQSDYVGTTNQKAIEAAASYYCMSIISYSSASRYLKIGGKDSDNIAEQYMELAEKYIKLSENFISNFVEISAINAPTHKINENSTFADRPPRFSFNSGRSAGKQT